MNDFYLFSDAQYNLLQQKYAQQLSPRANNTLNKLNQIIDQLYTHSFNMPLRLQNTILNLLQQAKQALEISCQPQTYTRLNISNSPFQLIFVLGQIAQDLNTYNTKCAYQILYAKSNYFIIDAICKISNYFLKK